jgi:hypothetical protein
MSSKPVAIHFSGSEVLRWHDAINQIFGLAVAGGVYIMTPLLSGKNTARQV